LCQLNLRLFFRFQILILPQNFSLASRVIQLAIPINPPENFKSELTSHNASILVPRNWIFDKIGFAVFIDLIWQARIRFLWIGVKFNNSVLALPQLKLKFFSSLPTRTSRNQTGLKNLPNG